MLHTWVKPYVPITVFQSPATKILIDHKWAAFGWNMFKREVAAFALRLIAWQLLAFHIARHGIDAVPDVETWRAVLGGLLAAASMTLTCSMAQQFLPLSPRSPHYLTSGRRYDFNCISPKVFGHSSPISERWNDANGAEFRFSRGT